METAMIALTDKQERFVHEYLIDQNASAAARRAGYSPRSASSVASELMNTPHVRERVEQALRDMLAEIKCSAMELMRERMRAAFFRARRLFKGNELRAFDELDDETYDALFINYELRASGPIIRVRQPNREQALRALERVHERLDRLQDARCLRAGNATAGEGVDVAGSAPVPARADVVLDLARMESQAPGEPRAASAQAAAPAAPSSPVDAAKDAAAASTCPAPTGFTATPLPGEKTQVSSGSPAEPDPAQPKLSPFREVLAALRGRKGRETRDTKPGGRDDPNLLWGGTRPPTPEPEPSPALIEHLCRVQQETQNAAVREEMARRGGRIKPGPVRPPGVGPNYNPPWLRDDRPRFADGAGEFEWS
jgi:hypothetical protein